VLSTLEGNENITGTKTQVLHDSQMPRSGSLKSTTTKAADIAGARPLGREARGHPAERTESSTARRRDVMHAFNFLLGREINKIDPGAWLPVDLLTAGMASCHAPAP
jgi:hypothetical protein